MARVPLELVLVDKVSGPLRKANRSADKFSNTIKKTGGSLRDGSRSLGAFGLGARTAGRSAKAASAGVTVLGATVTTVLGPLAVLTTALGVVSKAAEGIAGQGKANAALETLKVSSKELAPMLLKVSNELKNQFSQTELTIAAYEVASAGFTDAADAAIVLKASALAAGAGLADLATTGDAVTTVLNAWKMSASDAEMVANKMQQTVADGKIKISEYASGIGKVATVAGITKVSLDEVNAAVSLATASGVRSEVAFTGMKTALLRLTGEAGGVKLKQLGIDINASTIAAEGLAANLQKLEGLGIESLESIFGQEAIQTMAPVIANLEKYNELLEKQANSANVAKDAFEDTADTIGGAWQAMAKVINNLFSSQAELGIAVKNLIQIVTGGLKIIAFLLEGPIAGFNLLLSAINGTIEKIKQLLDMTPPWLIKLLTGQPLIERKTPVTEATKAMEGLGKASEGTGKTIENAFGKNVATVLKNISDAIKKIGQSIRDDITGAFVQAVKGVSTLGEAMSRVFSRLADQALEVAMNMALWGTSGTGGLLGNLFTGIGGAIGGIFGKANGGPVARRNPYIVGERGPEIFVPNSSGMIVPNNRLGGGTSVVVNVDASGNKQVEGDDTQARMLGGAISAAVQAELVRQKMPGGLLYG